MDAYNHEEAAVVAVTLQDASQYDALELTKGDFVDPSLSQIWEAIGDMIAEREVIDPITVAERLKRRTGRQWMALVGTLVKDYGAYVSNVATYARMVRENAQKSAAHVIAHDLVNSLRDGGLEAVDVAIRDLMGLQKAEAKYDVSISQAIGAAIDQIETVWNMDGDLPGVSTGIRSLDSLLGGMQNGDLVIVGARPAMGKTAFMLNLSDKCGVSHAVVSAEQGRAQIAKRYMSINGNVDAHKLRVVKTMEDSDFAKIAGMVKRMEGRTIRIYDKPSPTLADIQRQARRWKFEHDCKIIFIDYLQRLDNAPLSGRAKHEKIGEMVKGLKNLALELDIPIVALAQVKREAEGNRPKMADIADSSEIEKEADVVITMYRDEVYNDDSPDKGTCELLVQKNRHGPTAMVKVVFLDRYMRFEDYERREYSQTGSDAF